jgi:hypothetical protein
MRTPISVKPYESSLPIVSMPTKVAFSGGQASEVRRACTPGQELRASLFAELTGPGRPRVTLLTDAAIQPPATHGHGKHEDNVLILGAGAGSG